MTWEPYMITKDIPENTPNLYIYNTETGDEVYSVVQKRQTDWEPNFSSDESLMAVMIGGEGLFYEINSPDGFKRFSKKLGGGKNGGISVSPEAFPPHVAFYVPGVKGAPSMCRLYKYPNLESNQPVASKSFFQADKVEMMWNKKGTGLLIFSSTDVDTTGASYYGKQALHFLSTKGDSCGIQLNTEGPIHAVEWSPKSNEFCVVYGYMPSKATMFNLKCDPIFDFGTGNRNSIYFNRFGNLVLFGGFGNLRGNIEIWDLKQKKQVSTSLAPDTTLLEWAPTGDIYFTATCAPRLRMSNGFKIWHYSGALLHETFWPEKQELLECVWQNSSDGTVQEPIITNDKVEGIASSQPQPSATKYVPPSMRGLPPGATPPPIPGLPPGYTSSKKDSQKKGNNNRKNNNKPRPQTANSGDAKADDPNNTPQGNKKPREKAPRKPREPRQNNDSKDANGQSGDVQVAQFSEENGTDNTRKTRQTPRSKNWKNSSNTGTPDERPSRHSESHRTPRNSESQDTPESQSIKKRTRNNKKKPNSQETTDGNAEKNEFVENPEHPAIHQQHDNNVKQHRPPREHRPERPHKLEDSEKPRTLQKGGDRPNKKQPKVGQNNDNSTMQQPPQSAFDPDKEKKKKINKKLKDIKILKEKLEKGEKLDANQMNKINSESELVKEMLKLNV